MISSYKPTNVINLVWRFQNEKDFAFSLIFPSFGPSNKSGFGKSWQRVNFEKEQGRTREERGRGVKTWESWANVLFECPLSVFHLDVTCRTLWEHFRMALINFVTVVVLKILDNLFSIQNLVNAKNCWHKQNCENCPMWPYLYFKCSFGI